MFAKACLVGLPIFLFKMDSRMHAESASECAYLIRPMERWIRRVLLGTMYKKNEMDPNASLCTKSMSGHLLSRNHNGTLYNTFQSRQNKFNSMSNELGRQVKSVCPCAETRSYTRAASITNLPTNLQIQQPDNSYLLPFARAPAPPSPLPPAHEQDTSTSSSSSSCTNTRNSSTTTSTSSTRTYQNHHHAKRQTSSTKHQTSSTMHQTSTTGEPAPAPAAPAPAAPARPPPTAAPAPSTRPVAPSIQMPKFLQKALLERGPNEVRTRFERGPNETLKVSQTLYFTAYPAKKKTPESSHIPCKGGWLKCYFVTALVGESCFRKFGRS